jgi:two-component system, chemotaxis family, sensor kinase Cph1
MNGNWDARIEEWIAERPKLKRRNEELEEFAEIVAHDLKEPLRGIRHYVDFALQDGGASLPEPTKEILLTVRRLASRMTDRIEALYRYTCCQRSEPEISRVDPRQVVSEVLEDLRPWLDERRARVSMADSLQPLDCDPALLTEIFHNLVTNAVKYNDRPEPHVEIGMNANTAFYVRDDGIGIREEDREAIFGMYRRLHAHGQYGGGTGAGLAIVRRLIERLGGRIWIESIPGQGSTFHFTLAPDGLGDGERGSGYRSGNGQPC